MIAHYYPPGLGALCGSTGGEGHADLEHVTCARCRELAGIIEPTPEPKTAAEAIQEVADLIDKPPTDDTAGEPDSAEHVANELAQQEAERQAVEFARRNSTPAPMEALTSEVTRHDPEHYTERALRSAASWQVLCQARLELHALASQTFFHGAYPLGEVTRLAQDLHKAMVKEAYAYGMHQKDLEWLVAGVDLSATYHEHFEQTWGSEFANKLRLWWLELYEQHHKTAVADQAERVRLSTFEPAPHSR